MAIEWKNIMTIPSHTYTCGYCGNPLASEKGFYCMLNNTKWGSIYICHECNNPTYFDINGKQTPGVPFGNAVHNIPDESVANLYNEARQCIAVNSFTASVLCSRKLLMNIAVSKGAKEGMAFIDYVNFLADKNYIPPDGKEWVDYVRTKGNEATHEIAIMKKEDAEELLLFIEMLLKFIFEFPTLIRKKAQ